MNAKATTWRPGPSVCRCCLAEGCYKDISTEYFWMGKREVYEEMLADTFDLNIMYSKSGPNSNSRLICESCISRLRDATDFKRQVSECERTFQEFLDPSSGALDVEVSVGSLEKGVKLEDEDEVKEERGNSDDDDDGLPDFGDDDDDDDLDDQPLQLLASKTPKKESVDFTDLLDNAAASKRKSSGKDKGTPSKKAKTRKDKQAKPKVEKKKKDANDAYCIAKRNAELIVKYTTAYPFRLPEDNMVCVYCCESFDNPAMYRKHMETDHEVFKLRMAFAHCSEGYIKVDCTDLRCRICSEQLSNLPEAALHLYHKHSQPIDLNHDLGVQPFKLEDKLLCAICNAKSLCFRQLSRHTQSHFSKYTCESCGKSYSTNTALRHHITYCHTGEERICRKCKKTFPTLDAKKEHLDVSKKCWSHLCNSCGERFLSWHMKQSHMVEVHGAQKRTYACPECPEVFIDRKKYRIHFKICHTDDNFVCSCCGLKFDTKRNLEEHRVVHTKEKLFPCTVCSKSFPRKKNLVQHMWIHSEYKRFACTLCNKQFNQRVSWKTHMKSYHPDLVDF